MSLDNVLRVRSFWEVSFSVLLGALATLALTSLSSLHKLLALLALRIRAHNVPATCAQGERTISGMPQLEELTVG